MAGNRFIAAALTAAAAVGSAVGGAVYQAATQSDARVAIAAAHDVTTRHGELVVRVDAGGADVTALAAVDPGTTGQVLTVGDAGIPVWRAAAGGIPEDPLSVAHGGTGAATAADARTALGAWPGAVSADPMTGSGWTATTPASTTATWSGGVLSIVASAGATGTSFVARDAIDTGATSWDLAVRIDVVAGDGMGVPRGLALVGWYVSASDYSLTTLRSDRRVGHFTSAAGSFVNHGEVAGPSSGDLTGGQFWLRHTRGTDGKFVSWWGVGTGGATPTVWTRLFVVDSAALITAVPSTAQAYVGSGAYGEGALTSAWSVDVLAIRPSWQGSL